MPIANSGEFPPAPADAVALIEYETAGLAGSVHVRTHDPVFASGPVLLVTGMEIEQVEVGVNVPAEGLATGVTITAWLPHWPPAPPLEVTAV